MSEVKGKPGGQAEVGQVLEFKHPYQFDLYGPYATVTRRTVTVDRPLIGIRSRVECANHYTDSTPCDCRGRMSSEQTTKHTHA